jgi:hypothetical protein
VKLRGRTEAPALGAEGAQFLSARGAKPQAHHGPLQRLLDVVLDSTAYLSLLTMSDSRDRAVTGGNISACDASDGAFR